MKVEKFMEQLEELGKARGYGVFCFYSRRLRQALEIFEKDQKYAFYLTGTNSSHTIDKDHAEYIVSHLVPRSDWVNGTGRLFQKLDDMYSHEELVRMARKKLL